jgi:ATP-dependent 26S proteasome regulatory subunit
LESALAGRIDQAIEVPVPNGVGREKLVRLYGRGLPLGDAVVSEAAQRTEALDDMLFAGGKLNVKLLGRAREVGGG